MELSKNDKRVCREIIEKGLLKEYRNALLRYDAILQRWKSNTLDEAEAYWRLNESVIKSEKHFARCYGDISSSRYLMIIAILLGKKIIAESDMNDLSDEAVAAIKIWAGMD